ncbi:hypothetical protein E8E13_004106 [Curvularia kusanoi]|uniref:TLC domain-containing protein n=1 Tax=Curvularia kusanoi TaxID=90978 RepID=A0A9P4W8D2_CURKU|nr:hypothetical protein E8E13_004106 [Curvularia kusanoi]
MLPHDIEVVDISTLPPNAHSIQYLRDRLVSDYVHHGFLIMTITLVVFFFATRFFDYVFPKTIYRETCSRLDGNRKRRFVNHHISITAKILVIALAMYPYMAIVLGKADFGTPIVAGSEHTMGDVITIASAIYISVYLHELLYLSSGVKLIVVLHHIGAVIVASVMITRNVRWEVESNTTAYTVLIMTYGCFDVFAGVLPRPVMISRTVWQNEHRMNMWFCYTAMVLTVIGTVGETIVTMYLYGINFSAWSLPLQITTPICHVLFAAAQISSSKIMWALGRKHQEQLIQHGTADRDVEPAGSDKSPRNTTETNIELSIMSA